MSPEETLRIQLIAEALMLQALSASVGPGPATDKVVTAELLTASMALMTAIVMLMKRVGVDDAEAKLALQAQIGIVFDAVQFMPKAIGSA